MTTLPRKSAARISRRSALKAGATLAAAGVDREVRGEAGASDHAPAWVELKEAGGGRSSRASGSPRRGSGTAIPRENEQRSKAGRQIGRENAHESLLRRFLHDPAREQIGRTAGRESDDNLHGPAGQVSATAVGLQRLLSRKIAQPIVARFFPLLGEFARGGKPSITRVLASSCQNSPRVANRSFT